MGGTGGGRWQPASLLSLTHILQQVCARGACSVPALEPAALGAQSHGGDPHVSRAASPRSVPDGSAHRGTVCGIWAEGRRRVLEVLQLRPRRLPALPWLPAKWKFP